MPIPGGSSTRDLYGASAAEYFADTNGKPVPSGFCWLYTLAVGGTRITDILGVSDADGVTPLATDDKVVGGAGGDFRCYPPAGSASELWLQPVVGTPAVASGKRFKMLRVGVGTDLDSIITARNNGTLATVDSATVTAAVAAANSALQTQVTGLSTSVGQVAAAQTATQTQADGTNANLLANYVKVPGLAGTANQIPYFRPTTKDFVLADPPTGGGTGGGSGVVSVLQVGSDVAISTGLPVALPGAPVIADSTLGAIEVKFAVPPIGAGATLTSTVLSGAGATLVNTLTVPAGARRYFVTGLSVAVLAADEIVPEFTAIGSTIPGYGPQIAYIASGVARPALLTAPGAPASLVATAGVGQVSLAWTATTGASRYLVTRQIGAGAPTVLAWAKTNAYVDASGTVGQAYTYTVYAANSDTVSTGSTASGTSTAASTGTVHYNGSALATDTTHWTVTPRGGSWVQDGTGSTASLATTGTTGTSDNPMVQRTAATSESVGLNILRTRIKVTFQFVGTYAAGFKIETRTNTAHTTRTQGQIFWNTTNNVRLGARGSGAGGASDYATATYPTAAANFTFTSGNTYIVEFTDDSSLGTNGTLELRVWDANTGSRPSAATASVAPTTTELTAANMPAGIVDIEEYSTGTGTARQVRFLSVDVTDLSL